MCCDQMYMHKYMIMMGLDYKTSKQTRYNRALTNKYLPYILKSLSKDDIYVRQIFSITIRNN